MEHRSMRRDQALGDVHFVWTLDNYEGHRMDGINGTCKFLSACDSNREEIIEILGSGIGRPSTKCAWCW